MTAPSSLSINLPPSFGGSFWSVPYRRGVQALYTALQRGLDEDAALLAHVEHRVALEYAHAEALAAPTPEPNLSAPLFKAARAQPAPPTGIAASLRLLEHEATTAQSQAFGKVASTLDKTILVPFGKWSDDHERRVRNSWEHVDAIVESHETQQAEVERQRMAYEQKCRVADEAEEDARFAGGEVASPSPSSLAFKPPASPDASEKQPSSPPPPQQLDPERLKRRETLRNQMFGSRRAAPRNKPSSADDRYTTLPLSPRAAPADLPQSSDEGFGVRSVSAGSSSGSNSNSTSANMQRSSSSITSTLSAALSRAAEAPALATLRGALGGLNDPRHVRLRRDAEHAEESYRTAVRALDRARLGVEETLMVHFGYAERWENERVRAVRSVIAAFNAAFVPLLPILDSSLMRKRKLDILPGREISHLLRLHATGPYQPQPAVFAPYYNGESTSLAGAGIAFFGMNLEAFRAAETLAHEDGDESDEHLRPGAGKKGALPALPLALSALLAALERAYDDPARWPAPEAKEGEAKAGTREATLHAHQEKRKAWIYDVPLSASHACREALITHVTTSQNPGAEAGAGLDTLLQRFDAPTLAATVKLWALELADSLVPRELWEPVNSTYAAAAAQERDAAADEASKAEPAKEGDEPKLDKGKGRVGIAPALEEKIRKGVLEDLGVVLMRLSHHRLHLVCLDAIVSHLATLIKKTPTDEPEPVFLNKLGLAVGRALIRPPRETPATMSSRAPTLLAMDLVAHYAELFPPLLRKAQEGEAVLAQQRRIPIRKRTKPIDVRPTRRNMNIVGPRAPMPSAPAQSEPQQSGLLPTSAGASESTQFAASPTSTEAPLPPVPDKPRVETSVPRSDAVEAPTPLSERVLGAPPAVQEPTADESSLQPAAAAGANIERPASATSGGGSTYGTPPSSEAGAVTEASSAPRERGSSTSSSTGTATPAAAAPAASQPSLPSSTSNVARLSRQFGSMGSGTGASTGRRPGGARPLGARAPGAKRDEAPAS